MAHLLSQLRLLNVPLCRRVSLLERYVASISSTLQILSHQSPAVDHRTSPRTSAARTNAHVAVELQLVVATSQIPVEDNAGTLKKPRGRCRQSPQWLNGEE